MDGYPILIGMMFQMGYSFSLAKYLLSLSANPDQPQISFKNVFSIIFSGGLRTVYSLFPRKIDVKVP